MRTLTLKATFATNVRFGTGRAQDGLDEAVDRASPLSGAAIKGVLRDEARWLLPGLAGEDHPLIQAVFGHGRGQECPWNFDVSTDTEVVYTARASVQLDEHGVVVPGALLVKEEASVASAQLVIIQRRPVTMDGLPPSNASLDPIEYHLALLHVSARAAEKVGQRRSRGLGWVAFVSNRDVAKDLQLVLDIRKADAG